MTSAEERRARHDAMQAAARAEIRAQTLDRYLARRPKSFTDDHPVRPEIEKWISDFLAGSHASLLLLGEPGTGKTWHLWKIGELLIRRGWFGRYYLSPTSSSRPPPTGPSTTSVCRRGRRHPCSPSTTWAPASSTRGRSTRSPS